ncbi:hypothetical protein [Candidatus Leptofilum sp.]|uniref:hypothetical protein n=1 Tax=Candidatus Leptofilum sp. TaxID=3241576 RepID=UPI003B59F20E
MSTKYMQENQWMTIESAARYFGYKHLVSLRRRLRQLRKQGRLIDVGNPPQNYLSDDEFKEKGDNKVVVYWLNPRLSMISKDTPVHLLNPKRGRRSGL